MENANSNSPAKIFLKLIEKKRISAFADPDGKSPWVLARVKSGETPEKAITETRKAIKKGGYSGSLSIKSVYPEFHLLGAEFRPGSGVIRMVDGHPRGPAGALTCFLSSRSGDDLYFLSAGHVLTNYWRGLICDRDRRGSIYRNIRGFPESESQRFAGKLLKSSSPPPTIWIEPPEQDIKCRYVTLDAGIIALAPGFTVRQRTTCFGSFHDLRPPGQYEPPPRIGREVIKCGPEEPHETRAFVIEKCATVEVRGPRGERYLFSGQTIVGPKYLVGRKESEGASQPGEVIDQNAPIDTTFGISQDILAPYDPAFAAAGDSGTMVVEKETKIPVGMLVAGSILSGMYLVTPIDKLKKFWEEEDLIFRRG